MENYKNENKRHKIIEEKKEEICKMNRKDFVELKWNCKYNWQIFPKNIQITVRCKIILYSLYYQALTTKS